MKRATASTRLILLAALSLPAGAIPAGAQQPSQAQVGAIKQSCRSDYQSFCAGVPTGGSAALQCLQGHIASLSPGCQTAVSAVAGGGSPGSGAPASRPPPYGASPPPPPPPMSPRQQAAIMRRSCGGDYRAFCQGVPPGEGRAMACLSENRSRLSPSCQGALAELRGAR